MALLILFKTKSKEIAYQHLKFQIHINACLSYILNYADIFTAAYLRSLRIRAAEEKNIPRPSTELMNCKQGTINFTFHLSPSFHVADPYYIRTTLVN